MKVDYVLLIVGILAALGICYVASRSDLPDGI